MRERGEREKVSVSVLKIAVGCRRVQSSVNKEVIKLKYLVLLMEINK